jgi:tetratricopeptide (TPR) repeat protein
MAVGDYLGLLSHRSSDVLAEGKPINYPVSFVSGLRIACEGLAADRPPALDLLTLAAFMAPEPIPLTLFSKHAPILPGEFAEAAADPLALAGLVRVLRQRRLARVGPGSIQVHRLVQKILREASAGVRKTAVALLAAELLNARRDQNTDGWNDLLPHVLAVTDPAADPHGVPLPMDTENLVYAAVHHLRTQGKASVARPLLERVLRSREIRYGPSHALVGNVLIHLGWALRDLGDPAGALVAYDRALRIRQTRYGPGHPQVATALTNCGLSLRDLGRPGAARPLHEQALSIRKRTYGPDHRHVATVLTYLGQALTDLGEPAQARLLHERALEIRVSTYGPDHRHVATVLTNLGQTLAALGDLESAREVLERALHIREQAYGPDHPRVGATAEVLDLVMRDLGAVPSARTLLQRSYRLVALAYGQAHPTTSRIAAEVAALS